MAQRSGTYPPPPGASDLPGLEIAGEVVAVGSGASKHKIGDKVMSLVAGGGYAQYCIAQDAQAMAVPPALSMLEAGAVPETLMTVWHNVFERGALKAGETLLIHGGSSGIGTMAIQLAKAFGAKVIVTVGSKEKADACLKLGADHAINYKTEDFVAEVKTATGGHRRQRHPRHGRRRLRRAQLRRRRGRRPHRPDRRCSAAPRPPSMSPS